MKIIYRKATVYDYTGISLILSESDELHSNAIPDMFPPGHPSMSPYKFQSYLSSPYHVIIVAELNGLIVGYSFVELLYATYPFEEEERCTAFIDYFGVKKAYHQFGIGAGLFEQTKKWALKQKAFALQLNVWEFNEKAIRFYEKQGMSSISRLMQLKLKERITK
ncbi:GNAT family N-acetyltransferase [Priestia abyssalis]|uniref:GNAT family N-acetyltransferase n=1 Tax=Priestia abyssalis TaxID=1221450 RepID=UPI0014739707|nr:GNAT family N-acetyltransferase [Priestia abyssalis]